MRKFTKSEIENMRKELAEAEWEGLSDKDLRAALWYGVKGWEEIPDNEIVEEHLEVFDDEKGE
jgi:hypothetical protein